MNRSFPRYSTSEALLNEALSHASSKLGAEARLIKLNDLKFKACEGYYSKSAEACIWPCTITQMEPSDELEKVYEGLVYMDFNREWMERDRHGRYHDRVCRHSIRRV
jgi:multimeric flavodoxin WrbA